VKLYADESGHKHIRGLVSVAVTQLARAEVPAALWRKQRMGELSASYARLLTTDFEADYFGTDSEHPRFAAVVATGKLLNEAARLCASHGLRAYDVVQCSRCVQVDENCTAFAAFDRSVRTAAAAEGFHLVPSNLPDPAQRRRSTQEGAELCCSAAPAADRPGPAWHTGPLAARPFSIWLGCGVGRNARPGRVRSSRLGVSWAFAGRTGCRPQVMRAVLTSFCPVSGLWLLARGAGFDDREGEFLELGEQDAYFLRVVEQRLPGELGRGEPGVMVLPSILRVHSA